MKVKDLIEILQKCNQDYEVFITLDRSEFWVVNEVDDNLLYNEYGDVGFQSLTEKLANSGFTEEDLMIAGTPFLALIGAYKIMYLG